MNRVTFGHRDILAWTPSGGETAITSYIAIMKDFFDNSHQATKNVVMKDSFQNKTGRRVVNDTAAMRALAHPDRLSTLLYLMSAPSRTATECADEIGITPSACSYHLRELERFGYAERVDSAGDGRTRPWKASAVGFSIGQDTSDASPAARAARHAVSRAELIENQRLMNRYLEAAEELDTTWTEASDFHNFELLVSPDELIDLNAQIAELLSSFRAPIRSDPPEDSAAVHVIYQAFPRVDRM